MFDKLRSRGIIELELTTNFDSLRLNREEEKYYPAYLKFRDTANVILEEDIKVSARGNTRRDICTITPVRLKFPKPLLKSSDLARFKTLKLVSPCKDSIQFEDYLLREHLCYQLYNLITEKSFRVQMANVRFINSADKEETLERYSFLIEHHTEMAERLEGRLMDDEGKLSYISRSQYNQLCLFQYMIGNTDWNLDRRHNIKMVDPGNGQSPIPVPYDFDFSGFVNASYASPHPSLPIKSVRDRLFQWRGKDKKGLEESIQHFIDRKKAIFDLLNACLLINENSRNDLIQFIDAFYKEIESANAIEELTAK
jgi:hypothetical protein